MIVLPLTQIFTSFCTSRAKWSFCTTSVFVNQRSQILISEAKFLSSLLVSTSSTSWFLHLLSEAESFHTKSKCCLRSLFPCKRILLWNFKVSAPKFGAMFSDEVKFPTPWFTNCFILELQKMLLCLIPTTNKTNTYIWVLCCFSNIIQIYLPYNLYTITATYQLLHMFFISITFLPFAWHLCMSSINLVETIFDLWYVLLQPISCDVTKLYFEFQILVFLIAINFRLNVNLKLLGL